MSPQLLTHPGSRVQLTVCLSERNIKLLMIKTRPLQTNKRPPFETHWRRLVWLNTDSFVLLTTYANVRYFCHTVDLASGTFKKTARLTIIAVLCFRHDRLFYGNCRQKLVCNCRPHVVTGGPSGSRILFSLFHKACHSRVDCCETLVKVLYRGKRNHGQIIYIMICKDNSRKITKVYMIWQFQTQSYNI